jgi:uncharacterized protein YpmS
VLAKEKKNSQIEQLFDFYLEKKKKKQISFQMARANNNTGFKCVYRLFYSIIMKVLNFNDDNVFC